MKKKYVSYNYDTIKKMYLEQQQIVLIKLQFFVDLLSRMIRKILLKSINNFIDR